MSLKTTSCEPALWSYANVTTEVTTVGVTTVEVTTTIGTASSVVTAPFRMYVGVDLAGEVITITELDWEEEPVEAKEELGCWW